SGSSSAAKVVGAWSPGSERKSTEPSAATSAAVRPSPITAYAPMGANPSCRFTAVVMPAPATGYSAVPEVVRAGERAVDVGAVGELASERAEADELGDEKVAVPVGVLVAPAREQQRLAADDRAEAVVHRRRHDQVQLRVLVLEQHEDDA